MGERRPKNHQKSSGRSADQRSADGRKRLGQTGERLAERFLRKQRFKTLARNYRTPVGELDLVMRDGKTVVFVEVKSLTSGRWTDPQDQLRPKQQQHLLKAAAWFLRQTKREDAPCRYDVVGVLFTADGEPEIQHVIDAFGPAR